MGLSQESCVPCRGGTPPLTADEIRPFMDEVTDWNNIDDHHIEREFAFPDFVTALEFVNSVGATAEAEGHHPDIYLAWGKVRVTIWTHKVDGLTASDFILAAKVDELFA